jgi:hypothetical protein
LAVSRLSQGKKSEKKHHSLSLGAQRMDGDGNRRLQTGADAQGLDFCVSINETAIVDWRQA